MARIDRKAGDGLRLCDGLRSFSSLEAISPQFRRHGNLEDLYRLLRSSHMQAQGIVDTLDAPLVGLDAALTVVNANRAFFKQFKVDREEMLGFSLFALGDGQWDVPELQKLLLEVIPKSQAVLGLEVTNDFPGLGTRTMTVSSRRLTHPDDASVNILVVFDDVTRSPSRCQERHSARRDASQNEAGLDDTADRAAHSSRQALAEPRSVSARGLLDITAPLGEMAK